MSVFSSESSSESFSARNFWCPAWWLPPLSLFQWQHTENHLHTVHILGVWNLHPYPHHKEFLLFPYQSVLFLWLWICALPCLLPLWVSTLHDFCRTQISPFRDCLLFPCPCWILDVFTHISVKLVKVDVCQYRADYSTLWRATICLLNTQFSINPALRNLRINRRKRSSSIRFLKMSINVLWLILSKKPLMSPSMNQRVPLNDFEFVARLYDNFAWV